MRKSWWRDWDSFAMPAIDSILNTEDTFRTEAILPICFTDETLMVSITTNWSSPSARQSHLSSLQAQGKVIFHSKPKISFNSATSL